MWSPPLDNLGNSVRGVAFAEKFIEKFNFHRFDNLVHLRSKIDPRKHRYDVCQQTVVSLLYSATTGDVTALRRFESQGLDMCGRDYDGRTALHLAAAEGHAACVSFLVQTCHVSPLVTDRSDQLSSCHHYYRPLQVGLYSSLGGSEVPPLACGGFPSQSYQGPAP